MSERASENIFYIYVKKDLKPVDKGIASVVGEKMKSSFGPRRARRRVSKRLHGLGKGMW